MFRKLEPSPGTRGETHSPVAPIRCHVVRLRATHIKVGATGLETWQALAWARKFDLKYWQQPIGKVSSTGN